MRGNRILFDNDYKDESIKKDTLQRGRNVKLIQKRNEALMHRYYYFRTFTKYKYEYILDILHNEFYLSKITLVKILINNIEMYHTIKKNGYSINDLKSMYIHFNWSLKDV